MFVWWLVIILSIIFGAIIDARGMYYNQNGVIMHKPPQKMYWLFVFILIFFAGLRSPSGDGVMSIGDTRIYNGIFRVLVKNGVKEYVNTAGEFTDWGFFGLLSFVKGLFHTDNQGLFFFCSLVTLSLMFYRYNKLDITDKETLFFTFITIGMYVSTMNGVRQWLASAMLFFAFPLIEEKKWFKYFAVVLLASSIHSSSFILLPLYFIVKRKAWSFTTKGIVAFAVFFLASYSVFGSYLSRLLENTDFFSQYSDQILSKGGGANIVRVVLYFVPVIFAYFNQNEMQNEPYYDIVINMSVLNALCMLLASTNWIYARLCIFFEPFMLILFIWVLKYCFTSSNLQIVRPAYFCLFLAYFWYQIYVGYGGQIYTSRVLGIGW